MQEIKKITKILGDNVVVYNQLLKTNMKLSEGIQEAVEII